MYVDMLSLSWEEPDCALPDNNDLLEKMIPGFNKHSTILRSRFKRISTQDARIRNAGLYKEWKSQQPSKKKGPKRKRALGTRYSDEFNTWWKNGPRTGRKFNAWEVWKDYRPDEETIAMWTASIEKQTLWRTSWGLYDPDHFIAGWQHMERWLRNKSWENESRMPPAAPPSVVNNLDEGTGWT